MNFLGHLYFSNGDQELMHANLFGDFVKGGNLEKYAPIVQHGVRLHRAIDSFMDQHPAVKELAHVLSPDLPKVSGIALDLFFDHFLSKHWSDFHPEPLQEFLDRFYQYPTNSELYANERFLDMMSKMKRGKWISTYDTVEGIGKICEGVSQRISFPNALKKGRIVLEEQYDLIEKIFRIYMKDAIIYFDSHSFKP